MSSNKPSSMPSNPNSRSSEISNPMRRSFTGNPFNKPSIVPIHGAKTPANSPLDFSRRGSVGVRESGGSLRDSLDNKENGKDQSLKPVKVRSPAVCSKGSKNFMSPTISASCKINESPRKRVLTERNEVVPGPLDPKSHVRKVTFSDPLEEGPRSSLTSEDLSGDSETLMSKNDADSSFETVNNLNVNNLLVPEDDIHTEPSFENEPDFVNLDPTFKLSPTATPPVSLKATVVSPLGADPLIPPYDPKTNYLSPRPQFLHYKPKSRIEIFRERELEDSSISGSFSDSEITEDTQSEGSQKESDVSSDEIVKEEECGQISESSPAKETLMPEIFGEAKEVPKPRFTVRAKAVALILLLAVAFLSISVTDPPVIDRTVFQDLYRVYESSEFSVFARDKFDQLTQFAETNFDEIAQNLQTWFTKLLSSLSDFVSDIRGAQNLAELQYYNLTVQQDDSMVYQYPIFGGGENEIGETHAPIWDIEESVVAADIVSDYIEEDISEEHYEVHEEQVRRDIATVTEVENVFHAPDSEQLAEAGSLDSATITGVESVLDAPESDEVLNMVESEQLAEVGNLEDNLAQEAEVGNLEENLAQEAETNLNVENQQSLNSEIAELSNEAYDSVTSQAQEYDVSKQSLDSDVAKVNDDVAEEKPTTIDAAIKGNEGQLEAIHDSLVFIYLVIGAGTVIIAGAGINWFRKGKNKSKSSMKQPLELQKVSFPSNNQQISPEKSRGPIEMDMIEDSSETSSFQQSSFYSENVANEGHKPGPEKKRKSNYRRESLASSSSDYSTGSQSYGSLTVYEKISKKQGHGDDNVITTPVRRSSRIRNQATSPS
ncbi:uncharacterized protein LOC106768198 [Vigna radiata var. radiata]|uniref:Uncharacterized protein LOC106768198 n=1 Tax=Vigna radiata var. radiata TaxID=3916 RepID=A0A1S3URS3_VIGRR|nr:uncharacterized protein LOC106768198 [Vigna radiata var. radiata]